ncbi:hypothetical protein QBC38DRAFT_63588 [Podospora fimiseda]|uniref:Uncharacterized protein n=1 Tax=Podospora fimiseda TaxID=252190 RepID=A0AAN7BUY3_9PEZI|nr:hypothetical protein QBC38DRAFT_63588 [Podospora fimiseda]
MSTPSQGEPAVAPKDKEKKGLGKVLSRVKTVLKKRRLGGSLKFGPSSSGATAAAAEPEGVLVPVSPVAQSVAAPEVEVVSTQGTKIPRSQLFAERAKKLGDLYGLELKPSEWHLTEGDVTRVEKPIRMRVHKKCHLCDTSFGLGKECPKCKHPRCKQCPRVPPKRSEAEREESRKKRAAIIKERKENAPIIADWDTSPKKAVPLTRPAKSGGQDLIHRKPRQRIRRTCCQCDKLFNGGSKTCEHCEHARCTDCPRDPAKKDKYPYGYPGDSLGTRVGHYNCGDCKHIFETTPEDDPACPKCSCRKAERLTPRRVEPEPDPEVWASLQAKLETLRIQAQ